MRIERAPTDPDEPLGHTTFLVLACACGVATIFPAGNFLLTTRAYRDALKRELEDDRLHLATPFDDAALEQLRDMVAAGAGHECDEWIGPPPEKRCLLCGATP
jgi:hypothetical protein